MSEDRSLDAAVTLSEVIRDYTAHSISPTVLHDLIRERWGTISALAHIVHGSSPSKQAQQYVEGTGVPINDMGHNAF